MKIKTQHTKTYRCGESIAKDGGGGREQEKSQNNNLTFQFKELEKEEQMRQSCRNQVRDKHKRVE